MMIERASLSEPRAIASLLTPEAVRVLHAVGRLTTVRAADGRGAPSMRSRGEYLDVLQGRRRPHGPAGGSVPDWQVELDRRRRRLRLAQAQLEV